MSFNFNVTKPIESSYKNFYHADYLQELEKDWDGVEFEKHHFLETYDKEFKKFLDKDNLRILELGIDKEVLFTYGKNIFLSCLFL